MYNSVNFCSGVDARHALHFVTTVASRYREESDVFRSVTRFGGYLLASRFVIDYIYISTQLSLVGAVSIFLVF